MLDITKCGKVYFVIRHNDFAILAQLIEHSIRNRKVVGLNPMDGSNFSTIERRFKMPLFYLSLSIHIQNLTFACLSQ